jgi:hypothetical protein
LSGVIGNYVLPEVCLKCGAQIQIPIAWFRENNQLGCPRGITIYFATDDRLEGAIGRVIRPGPEG